MYRELGPDEIVEGGDEVLNQTDTKGDLVETEEEDRKFNMWTCVHGYVGKKVKNCEGLMTGRQRVFRRRVDYER